MIKCPPTTKDRPTNKPARNYVMFYVVFKYYNVMGSIFLKDIAFTFLSFLADPDYNAYQTKMGFSIF
jgi:hypothetical protein